jgi:DNA (cytosine-5)-methyltransferase 1
VAPALIHCSNGERPGQAPRIYDLKLPLGTVVAQGEKHGLVYAFLEKAFGGHESPGISPRSPLGTVTTIDHHRLVEVRMAGDRREEVRAFITKFYGTSTGQSLQLPLDTVTAGGQHHGLVTVRGESFAIADIGLRMLTTRERARAQGFGDEYELEHVGLAKPLSKTAQGRMIGNSVCPDVAAAIVRANFHRRAVAA